MITPSYGLTATERVLPSMALDFTTAILDSRVTFTRTGNTATVTNSSGAIVAINADLPRFDYDPTTLLCKGLLIEEARTNVLVNSLINGTSLSTQLVTTTAVAYTLSFYGTGQIVLSGTSSATVVGTGAYPSRKTLTFTPTAGVLTLTVTGTVEYAQLEVGAFATSFIPTDATSKTRNADVAVMTGTNFSSWFNASEGSFLTNFAFNNAAVTDSYAFEIDDATTANRVSIWRWSGNSKLFSSVVTANSLVAQVERAAALSANTFIKTAVGFKLNDFGTSFSGVATQTDNSLTVPTVSLLRFTGNGTGAFPFNGWWSQLYYWPQKLTNNELQAFAK